MLMNRWLLVLLVSTSWQFQLPLQAQLVSTDTATSTRSPDGQLQVKVELQEGHPVFSVKQSERPILTSSSLGLKIAGETTDAKYSIGSHTKGSHTDETWQPVWGKRSQVRNRYNGMVVSVDNSATQWRVHFRVYDDAVAFRYQWVATDTAVDGSVKIENELTTLNFASDATCWSYNGENPNVGPEQLSAIDKPRQAPMLCMLAEDSYVAVYEAALYDSAWMKLSSDPAKTNLRIETSPYTAARGFKTPWRVLMFGSTPGDIVDSDTLMNLNPPCKLQDTSWIKPGVCFWDWRAWGHQADGFTYELGLASWKRFIDFAQETGVPYLLLDANWYGPEFEAESNPTESGQVNAVREALAYGKEHNVGLLLYLNDVAGQKYDLDAVLKNYSEWGAVGIKYGFMKGGGHDKVKRTRRIIELCARNHLFVDFHDGPIPPSGDMRTWPNCLTREFCHAQSDAKKAFTPQTFVTAAFVNGLAGPIDMNNGMFDLENSMEQRPRVFEEVPATIVAEAARTLIIFSGLTVLPDSADSYRKHEELFEFIAAQKMPWVESKTLQGEIGEYIVTMRQTGETFLVASATNEQARKLSIPLDFLGEGSYVATLYEDAPDAHFEKNREAYTIHREVVTAESTLEAQLAPGGGHCIRLVPQAD